MKIYAKDFTDKEKELFTDAFYSEWDREFDGHEDDKESGSPWGCPWFHGQMEEMVGDTIQDKAKNWFNSCKVEIKNLLDEQATLFTKF